MLGTEANQIAHGLIAKGVQRGDRVVLFLDNCVETAIGRKDDIIKSRGEKVSPREVEDVLHQHSQIFS